MRLFVFAIDARRKSPSFCPKKSPLHSGHKWQWVGIPKIFDKYQLCDASRILAHLAFGFEHYLWNCICKQLVELDFSPVIKRILRYLSFYPLCVVVVVVVVVVLVERVFVVAGDFLICADFAISASAGGDCYLTVCTA